VPSSYQDNLQRFYVVHPGLYLRSLLMMMGPFTTGGFWEKLVRERCTFVNAVKGREVLTAAS
jgi:hypothetical protein